MSVPHLGQDFCPIWSASVCASLQPGHQVLLLLLVHQVQGKLEGDGLHVGPLEGGRDVHVHLKKPANSGVQ